MTISNKLSEVTNYRISIYLRNEHTPHENKILNLFLQSNNTRTGYNSLIVYRRVKTKYIALSVTEDSVTTSRLHPQYYLDLLTSDFGHLYGRSRDGRRRGEGRVGGRGGRTCVCLGPSHETSPVVIWVKVFSYSFSLALGARGFFSFLLL